MNIAIITEFVAKQGDGYYGGVDARAMNLSKELAKRNEVHLFTSLQPGQERLEDHGNLLVHRLGEARPFVQRGDFLSRLRFNKICEKEILDLNPDVVEGSGFVSYAGSYRSGMVAMRPAMATVHEVWQGEWVRNMGLLNGAVGSVLERLYLKAPFDRYIAVSEFTKDKLVGMGIDPERVCVIKNGVDRGQFERVEVDGKFSSPTVVSICRLVSYKKVDLLIRAVGILRKKMPDIRLLIVGRGSEEQNLRNLVYSLGLERNVEFLGKVPTMDGLVELLKRSHLFVLPSIVEGFGMVVVEAMAAGTPYVASDIPPIREATQGGIGGRLFQPMDVTDLVRKMEEAFEWMDGRADARVRGLLEEYDWRNLALSYESEVKHLVGGWDGIHQEVPREAPDGYTTAASASHILGRIRK